MEQPPVEWLNSVVITQKRNAEGEMELRVLDAPDQTTVSQVLVEEWESGYYNGIRLDGDRFMINNEVVYRITERRFRPDGFGFAYAVKEEDNRARGHQ